MARKFPAWRWGAWVPAMGLLAACGYFGGSHSAVVLHPQPEAEQPLDPAQKALAGMVDAVGPSNGQYPVELKFSIRDRPVVGQDDEVDYALVPEVSGVDAIRVIFGAPGGLTVTNHGPSLVAVRPATAVPVFGSVTVRPIQAGLFTLTAAVGVQSPNRAEVWPFRIPVIVGEGAAQTAARSP
jgi:hypothetical protein